MIQITRIVIVDDEDDLVESFVNVLRGVHGMNIVGEGHNGKEAIKLCIKFNPDFLILDLEMPKYDGYYFLEKLQKLKSQVKVIVITALLNDNAIKKLNNFSVFSILKKPTLVSELVKIMK